MSAHKPETTPNGARPDASSHDDAERLQHELTQAQRRAADLQSRLREAQETLQAIRGGQVDALVVSAPGPEGDRIYTLESADRPYRVIVETMNEAATTVTPDGLILYANQHMARLLGLGLQEVTGQRLSQFVPPRSRDALPDVLKQAGREAQRQRMLLLATDGTEVPVHVSTSLLEDASPGPPVICMVITDLTDLEASAERLRRAQARQQALEASERYWRQMAEAVPQLVWTAQADGVVDYCNTRWVDETATTCEHLRIEGWLAAVEPADRARVHGAWQRALQQGVELHVEARLQRREGPARWFLVRAVPLRDEEARLYKWLCTCTDIDDRRRAEEALRLTNEALERRVTERTAEAERRADQLRILTSRLAHAEQEERRRLAQVLHDHLQQLLVGAKFSLEVLSRRVEEDQRESIGHVNNLIDQAIKSSRSLTVELSPPILHEGGLVAGLQWLTRWMHDKHGLQVALETEDEATTDRDDVRLLLFQAVRELLFNVVKHAGINKASVRLAWHDPEHLCVEVSDQGAGLDPEQVVAQGCSSDGGFGLFSVRERVALLGGRMDIDGCPGGGARFRLIVPVRQNVPQVSQQVYVPEKAAGLDAGSQPFDSARQERSDRVRLLLVDDHQVMRQGLRLLLSDACEDVEVVGEASDGIEAIEQARRLRPDVVLMDFSMPRMDGVEATRRLRAEMPHIQVIGLSMYEESDRAAAMLEAGAAAYLSKSGSIDVLLKTIRQTSAGASAQPSSRSGATGSG